MAVSWRGDTLSKPRAPPLVSRANPGTVHAAKIDLPPENPAYPANRALKSAGHWFWAKSRQTAG
jgi:hypothetical protein